MDGLARCLCSVFLGLLVLGSPVWAQGITELLAMLGGDRGSGGAAMGLSPQGPGACTLLPHPNKFKYIQLDNNRKLTRDCAPGTMFEASSCACVMVPKGQGGGPPSPPGGLFGSQTVDMLSGGGGGGGGVGVGGAGADLYNGILQQLQVDAGANLGPSSILSGFPRTQPKTEPKPIVPPPTRNPNPLPTRTQPRGTSNQMDKLRQFFQQQSSSSSSSSTSSSSSSAGAKGPKLPPRMPKPPSPSELRKIMEASAARRLGPPSAKKSGTDPAPAPVPKPWTPRQAANPNKPKTNPFQDALRALSSSGSKSGPSGPPQTNDILSLLSSAGGRPRGRPSSSGGSGLLSLLSQMPSSQSSGGQGSGGLDLSALLAAGGGGGGGGGGGPANLGALAGSLGSNDLQALMSLQMGTGIPGLSNAQTALLLGETPGPGLMSGLDTSTLLALRGVLGDQGATGGISAMQLHQLDRLGAVELSDLTPAQLAVIGVRAR